MCPSFPHFPVLFIDELLTFAFGQDGDERDVRSVRENLRLVEEGVSDQMEAVQNDDQLAANEKAVYVPEHGGLLP